MKYKKLELLRGGDNPLIRVTFEESYGFFEIKKREVKRDVIRCLTSGFENYFIFCDTTELIVNSATIYDFYLSKEKIYIVNF